MEHTHSNYAFSGGCRCCVLYLSANQETYDDYAGVFGNEIASLIEIVKVRSFSRKAAGAYWTRFVPIVTLCPMVEADIDRLSETFIAHLAPEVGKFAGAINKNCTTPISKLRSIQYVLSLFIGDQFISTFSSLGQMKRKIGFDVNEGARLFGPWMRAEIQELHGAIPRVFQEGKGVKFSGATPSVATLPSNVIQISQSEYLESVREHQAGLQSFRSMRRIDARRKNASALRLRHSQSLASLRQRLSQAMVRSTIQRLGSTTNPLA